MREELREKSGDSIDTCDKESLKNNNTSFLIKQTSTILNKIQQTMDTMAKSITELSLAVVNYMSSKSKLPVFSKQFKDQSAIQDCVSVSQRVNMDFDAVRTSKVKSDIHSSRSSENCGGRKTETNSEATEKSHRQIIIGQWLDEKGYAHKCLSKGFQQQLPNIERLVSMGLIKEAMNLLDKL